MRNTNREKLVEEIAEAIRLEERRINSKRDPRDTGPIHPREAAEVALSVIERPLRESEQDRDYSGVCNCGQSGYPENSPFSNHPHTRDCPQYSGKPTSCGRQICGPHHNCQTCK